MLRRLANVIYNAVDVFAPPLPLQEEFITHWENIANYYTDKRSSGKTPIEATTIPNDLDQMLFLIQQEQNEFDSDSPGPCIEYILQHRLLETICVLARADSPPGMKKHVLIFLSNLLEKSNYDLLPHVDVCLVIKDMITLCGEKLATPYENEEIYFISIICQKLRDNTNLVNCFLSDTHKSNELPRTVHRETTCSPRYSKKSHEHFPIIKSLMVLLQSPDREVVELASECLVICVSLTNDKVIKAIVNSNFSSLTISHLCALYGNIPKTIRTSNIEQAFFCTVDTKMNMPTSQRKLICFFKWVEFLNKLASSSQELISEDMAKCFHSDFLSTVLYYDLINDDEHVAIFATSILSACYYHMSPSFLSRELSLFLVGELAEEERQELSSHTVKDVLIKRSLSVRDHPVLGMTSLQLFEDLIRKPNDIILNSLVICNLRSRRYYNMSLVDGFFIDEDSEAFASHYLNKEYDLTVDEVSSGDDNNVFAPDNVEKVLHCFLQLMPDEIKTCSPKKDTESGYDTYVKEAQKQFQECIFSCENCDMPVQPLQAEFNLSDVESESSSQPEADATEPYFYEGSFLSMLFDNLEQMLHQRYEVNLQVTSLISKLALIPHPNLHEYLLNPFLPLAPGTRTLFTVLSKIVKDIQVSVEFMPNFKNNLIRMRHILLTEDNEDSVQFESQRTLEAIIVLEEFCKELSAIIYTKYHAATS